MSVKLQDLILYGSAVMPEDDATLAIGGAIDKTRRVVFADVAGLLQIISSAAGDTTQNVTVTLRTTGGAIASEQKTLNGTTAVLLTTTGIDRLLKAVKNTSTTGDVAVEAQTAERSGTAQSGAADYLQLDAGASAVDDYYNGMVLRLTGGTGSGQIRRVIDYVAATKRAYVSRDFTPVPDATTTFRAAKGMLFDKAPTECLEVRRPCYGAAADYVGSTRTHYEKLFYANESATDLTAALVKEVADPSAVVAFALEAALGGSTTNGSGNSRLVAPGALTFDSADKNVANGGVLTAAATQALWIAFTRASGDAALKTTFTLSLEGQTT